MTEYKLKSAIQEQWLGDMVSVANETPAGCFVEVGVYQGGSAERLYELTQARGILLHLFDTFTGMPFTGAGDQVEVGKFGDTSLDDIKAAMPSAVIHQGVFPATMPSNLEPVAFIHADVDQYASQKFINKFLWPRVVEGGIMMIDDYYLFESIRKAIDEDFPQGIHIRPGGRPYITKQEKETLHASR